MRQFKAGLPVMTAMMMIGVLTAGCDKNKEPFAGHNDPMLQQNYPRVSVEGKDLSKYLAFSAPNAQAGPDQPLSVVVPVRLLSNDEIRVQYRFEFLSKDGRMLRPEMTWKYLALPPRTQVMMEGAALDTNAADWRLVVRPSRSDY